jgi:Domain of unknown function (DUF4347)
MTAAGLRLMVYDRTCVAKAAPVGLSTAWAAGSLLYRGLSRLDAAFGATSWEEALTWLVTQAKDRPIAEIQYWGHGRWGRVHIDKDVLDAAVLLPTHRLAPHVTALRERLVTGGDALVWLRTCETFGAAAGHDFAQRLAARLGARVAGHTFIIGALQSGLHGLLPGHTPDWPADEGIAEGTADAPVRAHGSGLRRPRTITCFEGAVPAKWFA